MDTPKILLVDDNRPVLQCRQIALEQHGFMVITADSGLGALRIAHTECPGLVISDIRMAGMDGYELCRKIRELYDVPVILYSAYDISQELREAAKSVGAAVVMTSVCQIDELVKTIRGLLREEIQASSSRTGPANAPSVVSAVPSPETRGHEHI